MGLVSESATPDEWKFPTPVARLYRYVHREENPKWNAVRTPKGIGTLMKAHSYPGGCQVQLMRERQTVKGGGKNSQAIMRAFDHHEVRPANANAKEDKK